MKRNFVLLLAVLVAAVFAARTTNAAVPLLMSHQGRLLATGGMPVTGARDLTFRLYETPSGGAALWTEVHPGVPVTAGLFSVTLGSSVALSRDLLVTSGTLETARYLEVQVASDPPVSPRMRMVAAPYAVGASRLSGDVETLPGALTVKSMGGSTTGTIRMAAAPESTFTVIEHDADGDGICEARGIVSTKPGSGITGSASGRLTYDTDDDGVPENEISQIVTPTTSGVAIKTKGTGADKDRTIGGTCDDSSAVITMHIDNDGDGNAEARVRGGATRDVSTGLSTGRASSSLEVDVNDDGVPDNEISQFVTPTTSGVAIKTKGTGADPNRTIGSTCDDSSAVITMDQDDDGDGISEAKITVTVRDAAGNPVAGMQVSTDADDNGVADHKVIIQSDTTGPSFMAINEKGLPGAAYSKVKSKKSTAKSAGGFTSVESVASDSASITCDNDDDGDGHSGAKLTIVAKDALGNPEMSMRLDADSDDDGVVDNSVEQVSNASKAYMAIKTKGIGSPKRTTILAEASDSGIFEISVDDDNDGTARARGIVVCKPGAGMPNGKVAGTFSYDVDDDGDFDNEVDITSNAVGAGARLIGRGGSTTGTIRMTATPDSSVFDLGISGSTTGTIRIQTSSTGTANPIEHSSGAHLTIGGTWTNASDKNSKENFSDVDGAEILEKIEDLSITQWNYKSEDESITHIGPTAQDFKKAFGVGCNDKSISTIDPSGIALAAIKELIKQNQELIKANEELNKRVKALEKKQ